MDYTELLYRCQRVVGVLPAGSVPSSELSLSDCVRLLHQWPAGVSRHVTAEKLAHEMAEWIEATTHPLPPSLKPH